MHIGYKDKFYNTNIRYGIVKFILYYILFLLLFVVTSSCSNSDKYMLYEKLDLSINKKKSIIFEFKQKRVGYDMGKDTFLYQSVCSLSWVDDKIYYLMELDQSFPDGHSVSVIKKRNTDYVQLVDKSKNDTIVYSVQSINPDRLHEFNMGIPDFLLKKNFFENQYVLNKKKIKRLEIIDTVWNGTSAFIIKTDFYDSDLKNNKLGYVFRKSDSLPIAYYQKGTLEHIEVFESGVIKYLSTNTTLAKEIFQITPSSIQVVPEEKQTAQNVIKEGEDAPMFGFKDIYGDSILLGNLKGNVVILDFWYMSCFPCQKAIPDLMDISKKYDQKGLFIFGINPVDNAEKILEYFKFKGTDYSSSFLSQDIVNLYGIKSFPTTIVIDKEGKIVKIMTGWNEHFKSELEKTLVKCLP